MPRLRRGDQSDHPRSPDNNQRQRQLLTRTNRSLQSRSCQAPALLYRGYILRLQKNPEGESVRDQQ